MSLKSFLQSLLPTRTVYEYRDIIHIGPEYLSWTGIDGTYFKLEPLARVKGAREYLLAAYPAGYFENGYMPIYSRLGYTDLKVMEMGTQAFDAEIEREMANFTAFYYNLPEDERLKVDPYWRAPGVRDIPAQPIPKHADPLDA